MLSLLWKRLGFKWPTCYFACYLLTNTVAIRPCQHCTVQQLLLPFSARRIRCDWMSYLELFGFWSYNSKCDMKGTYPDWGILWFYSVTPGKCWGNVMCYFWPSGFDVYVFPTATLLLICQLLVMQVLCMYVFIPVYLSVIYMIMGPGVA